MFNFLLVVQAIIAAALVSVILVQKSEGGGLTSGGSPSGLMSARGAADFLTRTTAILAGVFILFSITLAFLAATRHTTSIDTTRAQLPPVQSPLGQPAPPAAAPGAAPFAGAAANAAAAAEPANATQSNSAVPLAK